MVKAAVADIVSPAVTTENPDRLFGQIVLLGQDSPGIWTVRVSLKSGNKFSSRGLIFLAVVIGLKPGETGRLFLRDRGENRKLLNLFFEVVPNLLMPEIDAETMLRVVLKQEFAQAGPLPSAQTV